MDKYYTPTIDEFFVGFECETNSWLNPNDDIEWGKYIIEDLGMFMSAYNGDLYSTEFRIKYLDKEDIESLDFDYSPDREMEENYGYKFITEDLSFQQPTYWKLYYWATNNRLKIDRITGTVFDGTIKNKSELKKLLKQLEIWIET